MLLNISWILHYSVKFKQTLFSTWQNSFFETVVSWPFAFDYQILPTQFTTNLTVSLTLIDGWQLKF